MPETPELTDDEILPFISPLLIQAAHVVRILDEMAIEIGLTSASCEFVNRFFAPMTEDPDLDPAAIAKTGYDETAAGALSITHINFLRTSRAACAYASQAISASMNGDTDPALKNLAAAAFWCGITRGIYIGEQMYCTRDDDDSTALPIELTLDENVALDTRILELFRDQQRRRGAAGGRARADKYAPIRALVLNGYQQGNWRSARQAAKALVPEAIKFSRSIGCDLSEDRAFDTVYGWIRAEMQRAKN